MLKADHSATQRPAGTVRGPDPRHLGAAVIIAGMLGLLALNVFGASRVMPQLAALLVAGGFAIAAVAWLAKIPRHETELTSWDLAGGLAFLGFVAAILAA